MERVSIRLELLLMDLDLGVVHEYGYFLNLNDNAHVS